MPRIMKLKFSEMMWVFKTDREEALGYCGTSLGEAGNPSYGEDAQVQAMRLDDEVIVTGTRGTHIIPADCPVTGFGDEKDGKTLRQIMTNEVMCNHFLAPLDVVSAS